MSTFDIIRQKYDPKDPQIATLSHWGCHPPCLAFKMWVLEPLLRLLWLYGEHFSR